MTRRTWLVKRLLEIRSSYWFAPLLLAVAAIALALVSLAIDRAYPGLLRPGSGWPSTDHPEGARSVLSTVSGSMITVAGVTFSMTLLAVSHASSQFGPRLMRNFMRDRGNQMVLGVFIATFLYCILVLLAVRAAGEAEGPLADAFVPRFSINLAIVLTLASCGVLIFFIHHVADSMRLSTLLASIGRELAEAADSVFPAPESEGVFAADENVVALEQETEERAPKTGYVQTLDVGALMRIATEHDLRMVVCSRPGDFVTKGTVVVRVGPAMRVTPEIRSTLRGAFGIGTMRTAAQNLGFLVDQLNEVAMRALSPGVNDPQSAIDAIRWSQGFLAHLATRRDPPQTLDDDEGRARIAVPAERFEDFCERIYGRLRPYFTNDAYATHAMMTSLSDLVAVTEDPARRAVLRRHATWLYEAAERVPLSAPDLDAIARARPE